MPNYGSVALLLVNIALLTGACSTTSSDGAKSLSTPSVQTTPHEIDSLISEVDSEMEASRELRYASGSSDPQKIPMEVNKEVERWLRFFSEQDRARYQRFLDRGEYYKPYIEEKLAALGVPKEIFYLAMIESGFQTHAASHASAVGIWQFIKPTGERYGLTVTPLVDERRDVIRATVAAASYLRDLHTVFQSWFLAMAAYNAGESRIMNAIMRQSNRNFWELAAKGALPKETMNYVPKFIAASIIGHHPEKFGFTVNKEATHPKLIPVTVPSRVYLNDVASALDVPVDTIKQYNPHIRTLVTPDHKATYDIWVPESFEDNVEDNGDRIASLRRAQPTPTVVAQRTHRVQRGETLAAIAMNHGTSVAELRRINRIRGTQVRQGTVLRLGNGSSTAALAAAAKTPSFHVVRRGENLTAIAKKYDVSVKFLKERNHLQGNNVAIGRRLTLLPEAKPTRSTAAAATVVAAAKTYRVRKGDNLHSIAERFGLDVLTLKSLNNLRRNTVYIGEVIKLSPKG